MSAFYSHARCFGLAWFRGCLAAMVFATACHQTAPAPPLTAQVSGELAVVGLGAPVRIVRDRWGVPHIYAETRNDAFFAQGFVQAQDRLFQMELWRRGAEGRLAEMLGANFIERDAMTRRLQYHGDPNAEWQQYGSEARQVAEAFVQGINAWVALARERRPEMFVVAGWTPAFWHVEDLLTRTDAFDRDATIAALEQQKLPAVVIEGVRRAAAPAFFTGLAKPPRPRSAPMPPTSDASLPVPSPRYLVHLHTSNWSAIGAAVPWRPGLVDGHDNGTEFQRPEQRWPASVRVTELDPSAGRTIKDVIAVKGRSEPFISTTQITSNGVVVATDSSARKMFTLAWRGYEPGTAPAFIQPTQSARRVETIHLVGRMMFEHALAISAPARGRFNIGPLTATGSPPFSIQSDRNVWDASRAMNAPGQSEDPDSPHYADLAMLWARGETIALAFSDAAVAANAEATLSLVPAGRH